MSLQTRRGFFGTIAAVVAGAVAVVTRKPEPQYFFVTRDVSRAEFEAEYPRRYAGIVRHDVMDAQRMVNRYESQRIDSVYWLNGKPASNGEIAAFWNGADTTGAVR